jgi:hypothetical protein
MQLAPVIQQEPTGCGIACVAILAGKSYAVDQQLWSGTGHVRTLLN